MLGIIITTRITNLTNLTIIPTNQSIIGYRYNHQDNQSNNLNNQLTNQFMIINVINQNINRNK